MKDDANEDKTDVKDIQNQKSEQKHKQEPMAVWEPGKGLKKPKDDSDAVRS